MTAGFIFFIICIVAFVIGFLIVKKVAGCLLKSIVGIVIIAILLILYFTVFK